MVKYGPAAVVQDIFHGLDGGGRNLSMKLFLFNSSRSFATYKLLSLL